MVNLLGHALLRSYMGQAFAFAGRQSEERQEAQRTAVKLFEKTNPICRNRLCRNVL
jgi:hypothetical protein